MLHASWSTLRLKEIDRSWIGVMAMGLNLRVTETQPAWAEDSRTKRIWNKAELWFQLRVLSPSLLLNSGSWLPAVISMYGQGLSLLLLGQLQKSSEPGWCLRHLQMWFLIPRWLQSALCRSTHWSGLTSQVELPGVLTSWFVYLITVSPLRLQASGKRTRIIYGKFSFLG